MAVDLSFGGSAFPRAVEVRQQLYELGSEGISPRFRRLDRLDAFAKCLEYAHHELDWNGYPADRMETISSNVIVPFGYTQPAAENVSVRQRRPTAPLRMCPTVIDRFTGLLFSEDRTPQVGVEGDARTDDWLKGVLQSSNFWSTMETGRNLGGAMGSVLLTTHLKSTPEGKGRFSYKAHSPKTVHDVLWLDRDLMIPAGVLIQYVTLREFEELDSKNRPTGRVVQKEFLFRRIIDEEMDIVFKEAPLEGGEVPDLEVDFQASQHHQLGFFPGRWVQNLPCDDALDGIPDCDGAYEMFDTIDRLLSQGNRSYLANMDPTVVVARDPKMDQMGILLKGSDNALNVGLSGSASYMEIAGAGIEGGVELAFKLKQAALDKVQCVLADPEKLSGAAQSAVAIKIIYEPMLVKAGKLRKQYGAAIEAMADLTIRMGRTWQDPVMHPGKAVPVFDIPPRVEEVDSAHSDPDVDPVVEEVERVLGQGGRVSLKWGEYFAPTPNDVEKQTGNVASAVESRLMDSDTAVEKVAPLFGVRDAKGMLRRIREEDEEKEGKLRELTGEGTSSMLASAYAEDNGLELEHAARVERAGKRLEGVDVDPRTAEHLQDASATALNGAQIASATEIILDVAAGKLPRASGVAMLVRFFNLSTGDAEAIMGPVGAGFQISPELAATDPAKPPPPKPPPNFGPPQG